MIHCIGTIFKSSGGTVSRNEIVTKAKIKALYSLLCDTEPAE